MDNPFSSGPLFMTDASLSMILDMVSYLIYINYTEFIMWLSLLVVVFLLVIFCVCVCVFAIIRNAIVNILVPTSLQIIIPCYKFWKIIFVSEVYLHIVIFQYIVPDCLSKKFTPIFSLTNHFTKVFISSHLCQYRTLATNDVNLTVLILNGCLCPSE